LSTWPRTVTDGGRRQFLRATGWDDEDGELAADMAAGYPPGTRLRPRFDHADEAWVFTPE
jgi:hypothetical protein